MRLRPLHGARPSAPSVVHLGVLGVGLCFFAVAAARGWFFYDDWYFLRQRPEAVWEPHVGHWNAVPALVFLGVQRVFGMDHYLPFALPAILAHLGAVHLVWRLMLRASVRPWVATAVSVLLTFLGAGAEALAWAVQIGFVGAITAMLGAVLLLDRERLGVGRGVAVAVLALLAVASSGTSLPFLLVAFAISWLRHGGVRTVAVFAVPVAAAVGWFLVEGSAAGAPARATGLAELLTVPQYAVSMLTDGLGRVFPVATLGGLVAVALAVWWVFTCRSGERVTLAARLLFLAAPVFALLTGWSRVGHGLETATSSRYVYVVVVSVTPLMALGLDRLTRSVPTGPVVAIVLLVAAWNVGGAALALVERAHRVDQTRSELATAASVIRADPRCLADDARPSPQWAPDVTIADLRAWLGRGWYHPDPAGVGGGPCQDG